MKTKCKSRLWILLFAIIVVVGIVGGSVAVVGIGGFALFWFVIKKKSFADLIAVFKKK